MLILAIETSCDETALALVEATGGITNPKFKIIKSLVSSQIAIHRPFGGVVPNLAKREHLKNLPILFKKLSPSAKGGSASGGKPYALHPDLIAVTVGPGLEPALWTGINFAQQIHKELIALHPKPYALYPRLIGVNHLEGHLYSFLLAKQKKTVNSKSESRNSKRVSDFVLRASIFPAIGLVVSGGHTTLLKLDSLTKRKRLGETQDDAVGEAFDKVARILGLPYPGGPEVEKLAKRGNPDAIPFPRPMLNQKNYNFSFSGLKTAVLYHMRGQNSQTNADSTQNDAEKGLRKSALSPRLSAARADVAASFQSAAIEVLAKKTMRAVDEYGAKSVALSGGVAANSALRKALLKECKKRGVPLLVAERKHNTDNAVMIAVAGYLNFLQGKKLKFVADGAMNV